MDTTIEVYARLLFTLDCRRAGHLLRGHLWHFAW
jgi:hypothetical protein